MLSTPLSIDIRYYIVQCSTDGNKVGNLCAAANRIYGRYQRKTRTAEVQTVGSFVAMALEEYAELTAAAFYGGIGMLSISCSMIFKLSMISSIRMR